MDGAPSASTALALPQRGKRSRFPVVQPPPRKARVQMTTSAKSKLDQTRAAKEGGVYNIWYNRMSMVDRGAASKDQIPFTRCNPELDSGVTRGSETRPDTTFCLHFARGNCAQGYDCTYLHRVPDETDESFIHRGIDCFGRERHREDRDDMNGTGSFDRENVSLYVSRIATYDDPEEVLERHFGAFGRIVKLTVLHTRNLAFVKYANRLSAEFAKEAMSDQSLDNNECLIVRWATDDPNPKAKKELKEELEAKFIKKMLEDPERQRQILLETQTDHDLNAYYQQGNTSASSAPWAAAIGAPPPPPPPKKKGKKKAVSATTVDSGAGKTASPGAPVSSALLNKDSLAMLGSAVKAAPAPGNPATAPVPTAMGLVAAYDSD